MKRQGGGAIITTGSQLAIAGGAGNSAYIAAKGADAEATFQALVEAAEGLSPEDRDTLSLRGIVRIDPARYLAVPIPAAPEQIAQPQ